MMASKLAYILRGTGRMVYKCVQYGCIFHCVTTYGISCVICSGHSMEPTIYNGDAYIVDCISVYRQTLKRGDIVGVKSKHDPNKYICKRITGMSGDKVYNSVSHEYIWIPKGHVWLEGDNKRDSHDSRYEGPYPYGLIFCRLVFRICSGHRMSMQSKER